MFTVSKEGAVPVSWAETAEVIARLKRRSGLDFSEYRRETLRRRIHSHVLTTRAVRFEDYLRLLEESPLEPWNLVERITIKVSRFYRNPATFNALRMRVLPELAQQGRPLRIWSAGCGRGEEAYTLAMLLQEADVAGEIHASDIDRSALSGAAQGTYPPESAEELPELLRVRYLQPVSLRHRPHLKICEELRSRISFFEHDLLSGKNLPPDAQYDLICCRNVLIYLQPTAQLRVLTALLSRLRPGGFLCLGEAEWPPAQLGARLLPLQRATRLFRHIDESFYD